MQKVGVVIVVKSSRSVSASQSAKAITKQQMDYWKIISWCQLGWYDFVFQHRRTKIGPLWQTLQMAVWAAGLIIVFGPFHADEPNYIPYVVSGLLVWGLLSSCLMVGTGVFTLNKPLILNIPNPLILYIVRSLSLIVIRFGFQFLIFIPVAIYYQLPLSTNLFWIIPAILLTLLCFGSSMMTLGVIGARFRDLEHLMSSVIRFMFFASPIFWIPGDETLRSILVLINPLAWFLDLIRLPLLGEAPPAQMIIMCIVMTFFSVLISFLVHRRFGKFVPTWL